MSTVNFNPVLSEKQTLAFDCLEDDGIDEILYGGAKYGGKSWFLCAWAYKFACDFARRYKIPQSKNPLPIGFLGRKVAKNFSDTTLETWFKTIPNDGYVAKGKPVDLIIDNRVKIHTGGLDNRETINKFNSAEYAFFCIDQAEEVTEDDVALLRGATFGRLVVNEQVMPGKGLFTANPRNCWLKNEFINNPTPKRRFIPALPTDNPYCTQRYIDNLTDAFKHRPELLRAFLLGDWSAIDDPTAVMKAVWLEDAKRRTPIPEKLKHYLVCDTARFGDDKTIIGRFVNTDCVEKLEFGKTKTTEISSRLAIESNNHGRIPIVVESVGSDIGAAVIDELLSLGHEAFVYCPQGASTEIDPFTRKPKFYNLRAEAWWKASTMLADGFVEWNGIKYVVSCPNIDQTIIDQLLQPTYDHRNGKLLIEPKASIKERLGRSPDDADMFVIGLWAFDKVDANDPIDTLGDDEYQDEPCAMGLSNL